MRKFKEIIGIPVVLGEFKVKAYFSNAAGIKKKKYCLKVDMEPYEITTEYIPDAKENDEYSFQIEANFNPDLWEIYSGQLPEGLELTSDGIIQGIPTELGDFIFSVIASDSLSFAIKEFSIFVEEEDIEPPVWEGDICTNWYDNDPSATDFYIYLPCELMGLAYITRGQWNLNGISMPNRTPYNFQNKRVHLMNDIKLNQRIDFMTWETNPPEFTFQAITDFAGTFDGHFNYIGGLYFHNNFNSYTGLFNQFTGSGEKSIKNLAVINSFISSSIGGSSTGCSLILGNGSTVGSEFNQRKLENCYAHGYTKSPRDCGGVLANTGGFLQVRECFANMINAGNAENGNLIGSISGGLVENCYSIKPNVPTNQGVLIGMMNGGYNPFTLRNSYTVGRPFQSVANSSTVQNFFYSDAQTATYGTRLTESQIQNLKDFAPSWDWENVWDIDPQINGGFPYLRKSYRFYELIKTLVI